MPVFTHLGLDEETHTPDDQHHDNEYQYVSNRWLDANIFSYLVCSVYTLNHFVNEWQFI